MPTKVPKGTGDDRSGRGIAVSTYPGDDAGKWQPNPRQANPFISGAGGSPSMSADGMAAQRMGSSPFGEEAYDQDEDGEDVLWPRPIEPADERDCGYAHPGGYRSPQESNVSENLLRRFIRKSLTEVDNRTGALGAWGRAPTDWDGTPTRSLGSSMYEPQGDPDAGTRGVCLKLALKDVDNYPKRVMMMGPPGFTGDTSHFWTEYEGEIFDSSGRAPDGYEYLGKIVDPVSIRKELEENESDKELLAEPDNETDDSRKDKEIDEFSGVGAAGGAGGDIAGYVLPLGKSGPTFGGKRKKPANAAKGWKRTHG
jgi:hypothetical protein